MSVFRIVFICWMGLCNMPAFAVDSGMRDSEKNMEKLVSTLPGTWNGRAIETPVGPVDYAISFHACDKDVVSGIAELDVSDHHWQFWLSDGQLRLTFLSTFRGNQEPVQLVVSHAAENTIHFHAPALPLLSLSVALNERVVKIRVFHHKKPHVYIRLVRSNTLMSEEERAEGEAKSCKIL